MASNYYSTSMVISLMNITQYLAQYDIDRNEGLFNKKTPDKKLPVLLMMEAASLEFQNTFYPSNPNIPLVTNYCYSLCGSYAARALSILGQGGGGIIVDNGGQPINIKYYRDAYIVGTAGAPISAGQTSYTINLSNFLLDSVDVYASGVLLKIRDDGAFGLTSVVYTATSVTITFNQPVSNGEEYEVTGIRAISGSTFSSGGITLPDTTGHEGEVLFTDGAGNYYWADATIDIESPNFENDGVTVNDTRMVHNQLDIFWNDINRFLVDGTEFTRISGGGFVITMAGFDANSNSYTLKVLLKGINA